MIITEDGYGHHPTDPHLVFLVLAFVILFALIGALIVLCVRLSLRETASFLMEGWQCVKDLWEVRYF